MLPARQPLLQVLLDIGVLTTMWMTKVAAETMELPREMPTSLPMLSVELSYLMDKEIMLQSRIIGIYIFRVRSLFQLGSTSKRSRPLLAAILEFLKKVLLQEKSSGCSTLSLPR